jgi:hypothetical protein
LDFTTWLSIDFGDGEELRWALEAMGSLWQGKDMAADYFLKLEQLASTAGVDINNSSHVLLQVEQNVNLVLINQLYQSVDAPKNYDDYKRQIVAMDKMRCRIEAFRKNPNVINTPESLVQTRLKTK